VTRLREQGAAWSEADLLRLLRIAAEAHWPMRDSPQPIVHLEAAVMQMVTLEPAESVATLIARLEALEARLAGSGGGARGPASAAPASPARSAMPPRAQAPAIPVERARAAAPPAAAPAPKPAGGASVALAEDASTDETIAISWRATVEAVNGRKRMLGAFLEESRLQGISGDALLLAMDDLHRAVVDIAEHRAIVREEIARVFGRPLDLRCVPPQGERPKLPSADDVKPMIDRAIEFFDGEVLERPGRGDRST
jgi:hypothetical protein